MNTKPAIDATGLSMSFGDVAVLRSVDLNVATDQPADPSKNLPDDLARLLDELFVTLVPAAPRCLELLRARGWTG